MICLGANQTTSPLLPLQNILVPQRQFACLSTGTVTPAVQPDWVPMFFTCINTWVIKCHYQPTHCLVWPAQSLVCGTQALSFIIHFLVGINVSDSFVGITGIPTSALIVPCGFSGSRIGHLISDNVERDKCHRTGRVLLSAARAEPNLRPSMSGSAPNEKNTSARCQFH